MPDTKDVTFITGTITGTPPAGYFGTETLAVVATDDDGASGRAEFDVVVDDGNDVPTAVNLANNDGTDNVRYQVEVDENTAGVALGTVSVDDIDSPDHPHGQHKWKVNNAKFEITDAGVLKLKSGMSLDHEAGPVITIIVTATDMNGEKGGESKDQDITVTVNDKNDAPTAIESIGNWWVTIDEDLDADDALKGQWLSFSLEGDGDDNPAFEDEDGTDKLTFSITSGPAWLEIDPDTGMFTNKAEMIAAPGKYYVTVRATDMGEDRDEMDADGEPTNTDGEYAEVTFMIAVAVSDAGDEDNDEPSVRVELINSGDYTEGSGKVAVARVTVTDEDFGLAPHPFGVLFKDEPQLGGAAAGNFELSKDYSQNGNARTWTVYTKANNSLDHETEDDIEITVTAWNDLNGNMMFDDGEGDSEDINIDVDDANEAPAFAYPASPTKSGDSDTTNNLAAARTGTPPKPGASIVQGQAEAAKTTLYLNLMELWSDPDDDDDVDELTFGAPTTSTSWIKVLNFGQWEDIKDGPDGEPDDTDDGDTTNDDDVAWGDGLTEPADDDWVVIVEIDRMTNNGQTGDGAITLTATDEGGMSGSATIVVDVTDQNVPIPLTVDTGVPADGTPDEIGGTVKINGALREGNGLTMSFDHTKDPDFAAGGAPLLVEYTWEVLDDGNQVVDDLTQTSYGSPSTLMLTQAHVGMQIRASVMYFELDPDTGDIVVAVSGGSYTKMGTVANVQDAGSANIVYTTNGTVLQAEVNIDDDDGVDTTDNEDAADDEAGTLPVYTWQQSANGVGGWTDLEEAADRGDTMVELGATGGSGLYYRVVVTYTDNGGVDERIEGSAEKVGKLATKAAPTVTGSVNVGGTLIVDSGAGSVQWQKSTDDGWVNLPGATGDLTLTSEHGGLTLRALVTYSDAKGITAIAATADQVIPDVVDTDPVSIGNHEIEVVVMAPAKATDPSVITRVEQTVDVASLFQDADGDMLTYTSDETEGLNNGNYIRFDPNTGKLIYITDKQGNHDGGTDDGGGNVVNIVISASDGQGTAAESTVSIRLNVAPTAVTGGESAGVVETGQTAQDLLTLNVQDENAPDHDFGAYTWKVAGNDGFTITADTTDSSEAVLAVKAGQSFPVPDAGGMIRLTVTATDKAGDHKITHTVTITVTDNDGPDPGPSPAKDPVPGLKDDDSDADDTTDGDDRDTDGGLPPPPPPAMMFEDDLLDEFVLAIDDIDIA
jgi:hypothetical protein